MTQTSKYDFAYSVGVVRTLETMLLNENEVERMMLAKDAHDAFRILNEFDYADNKAGIENPAEFQRVISEGLMDIKENLDKITPDKRILNMLWHYYDFHNIKTLVKAKLSDKPFEEVEHMLNKLGAIPVDALKAAILEDQTVSFGLAHEETEKFIKTNIQQVQKLFEKEKNPQIIDLYLDEELLRCVFKIAQDSGNDFLITYVKKLIDLTNIKLYFRMKSQEKELDLFKLAFTHSGTIPFTKFENAYKHNLSEFPEAMKSTAYGEIVAEGFKAFEEHKSFLQLEKLIEDHLTEFIKRAKLIPFGPEPLIAYFLAKKNNALIIRMIMINKLNGIEPEEIKSRLRKLYA